jgi:hypothetical protein
MQQPVAQLFGYGDLVDGIEPAALDQHPLAQSPNGCGLVNVIDL